MRPLPTPQRWALSSLLPTPLLVHPSIKPEPSPRTVLDILSRNIVGFQLDIVLNTQKSSRMWLWVLFSLLPTSLFFRLSSFSGKIRSKCLVTFPQ